MVWFQIETTPFEAQGNPVPAKNDVETTLSWCCCHQSRNFFMTPSWMDLTTLETNQSLEDAVVFMDKNAGPTMENI